MNDSRYISKARDSLSKKAIPGYWVMYKIGDYGPEGIIVLKSEYLPPYVNEHHVMKATFGVVYSELLANKVLGMSVEEMAADFASLDLELKTVARSLRLIDEVHL